MMTAPVTASFDRMWADLGPVGRVGSGGYRRFAWTREDHTLREWFAGECAARRLDLVEDRMGNQWAWWWDGPGTVDDAVRQGNPGVAIGSHLDSVPDGGAYDGPLGVVSSLTVVDALRESGIRPDRPLAVVNFVDEEGARFGVACAGSRVITGAMTAERALGLTDHDGVSMADALVAAGRDPGAVGRDEEALRRVGAFVELHVEQGRALVDLGAPVAVASDIWPHGRWRFDFPGEANHAGTTRLEDRQDAMLGYADLVLGARRVAQTRGCVATVGKVAVTPGGVNAIPSQVTGWLDSRGADEGQVRATVEELRSRAGDFGATVTEESWTATTRFDEGLSNRLRTALGTDEELSVPVLGTGAGHDAGILATAGVPSAMLFVRNPTGVSHSPEEFAERDDCHAGVDALTTCVTDLVTS
ncbi:allantoate amidohydrolase [Ornithinimicrobium cryptoxanthini]|uniref:Allantoate amidohydrolase n=1 Tax=Ornithinimicrobium cryptoxanthini TaxID=2934161 RepID=A0ABY4YI02_9MICO|nr:allantoate amidohydrolase [Ornithinimicrobium cryptoxanthini]USQ76161.1 allantoate amidohydrolase [Ornithinimicrobium cryptoxanthini]